MSLDGVLQSPGGPEEDPSSGFDLGGWLVPYVDEGFNEIAGGWFEDADAFLFGRKTYQILASHWPNVTDPQDQGAAKLNGLPKYVATSTLTQLDWNNSHRLTGNLVEAISELKRQPGRALQVHGSGRLIQFLLQHELVDELRLLVFPVVLGKGQRLFEPGVVPGGWRLVSTRPTPSGVVGHAYEYAGKLAVGNIAVNADGKEELQR
ncbi:dihydrofolate reductase family protein [Dactylosporangium salmoneum]|uniref:Dihydrofolate reductase family protein n=1 Tax=Dactylosporangium salmoneum TaxID=53361 RepID=A0ABP5UWN1_9ACTN